MPFKHLLAFTLFSPFIFSPPIFFSSLLNSLYFLSFLLFLSLFSPLSFSSFFLSSLTTFLLFLFSHSHSLRLPLLSFDKMTKGGIKGKSLHYMYVRKEQTDNRQSDGFIRRVVGRAAPSTSHPLQPFTNSLLPTENAPLSPAVCSSIDSLILISPADRMTQKALELVWFLCFSFGPIHFFISFYIHTPF